MSQAAHREPDGHADILTMISRAYVLSHNEEVRDILIHVYTVLAGGNPCHTRLSVSHILDEQQVGQSIIHLVR